MEQEIIEVEEETTPKTLDAVARHLAVHYRMPVDLARRVVNRQAALVRTRMFEGLKLWEIAEQVLEAQYGR